MNKKYILIKNEEVQKVINGSNNKANKYYVVYYLNNNIGYNRYCISVGKKIGKAHTRNLYKRRVKDIILKNNFIGSNDYVIILRKAILDLSYIDMQEELIKIMEVK